MATKSKPTATRSPAPANRDASGTVTIGGKIYQVKGQATLPTFKIEEGQTIGLMLDGEIQLKPKTVKGEAVLDPQTGEPLNIAIVKVVNVDTGEVGQIVAGVVLQRALTEYPGGYVGKSFAITKHAAPAGQRAKPWTVLEIDPS